MASDLSIYRPEELRPLIGVSSISKDMWNVICEDPTCSPNLSPYSDDGELGPHSEVYTMVKTGVFLDELSLLNTLVCPSGIHRHIRTAIRDLCSVSCDFVLISVSG